MSEENSKKKKSMEPKALSLSSLGPVGAGEKVFKSPKELMEIFFETENEGNRATVLSALLFSTSAYTMDSVIAIQKSTGGLAKERELALTRELGERLGTPIPDREIVAMLAEIGRGERELSRDSWEACSTAREKEPVEGEVMRRSGLSETADALFGIDAVEAVFGPVLTGQKARPSSSRGPK